MFCHCKLWLYIYNEDCILLSKIQQCWLAANIHLSMLYINKSLTLVQNDWHFYRIDQKGKVKNHINNLFVNNLKSKMYTYATDWLIAWEYQSLFLFNHAAVWDEIYGYFVIFNSFVSDKSTYNMYTAPSRAVHKSQLNYIKKFNTPIKK